MLTCRTCSMWRVLGEHDGLSGEINTSKHKYGECGREVMGCIKWDTSGACPAYVAQENADAQRGEEGR